MRSTSQGGHGAGRRASAGRRSPARRGCRCGPRRPAAPGWSGRRTCRRTGTTATGGCASSRPGCAAGRAGAGPGCRRGSAPPRTTWLPPPVPVCRPSSMNFSVASRRLAGFFVQDRRCCATSSSQSCGRVDVDLDHAGVGGDAEVVQPVVVRRRVALDPGRGSAELGGRRLDGGDQVEVILQPLAAAAGRRAAGRRAARRRGRCGRPTRPRASPPAQARPSVRPGLPDGSGHAGGAGRDCSAPRRQRLPRARTGRPRRTTSRVLGRLPGERVERQAEAHRRVAGERNRCSRRKNHGPDSPARLGPVRARRSGRAKPTTLLQPLLEDLRQPAPLLGVVELALQRIDVGRQAALAPEVVPGVLVAGRGVRRVRRRAGRPASSMNRPGVARRRGRSRGRRRRRAPGRPRRARRPPPVAAKAQRGSDSPGIPLALAVVQQAAGGEAVAEAAEQLAAELRLPAPARRCSTRRRRGRRPRRRSARRPSSAARRRPRSSVVDAAAEAVDLAPTAPRCTAW